MYFSVSVKRLYNQTKALKQDPLQPNSHGSGSRHSLLTNSYLIQTVLKVNMDESITK